MTTKEQERQAIEKIRKIVEGLGADSYVGIAMTGVLEVAEQNIEFDAAFSLKVQAELAEKEATELKKTVEQQEKELNDLRKKLEIQQNRADRLAEKAEKRKMPDWIYEHIVEMTREERRRLNREQEKLAEQMAAAIMDKGMEQEDKEKAAKEYKHKSAEIQGAERFKEEFREKYEEDFLND